MESNEWDFHFGGTASNTITSKDTIDSTAVNASIECGVNSARTDFNGAFSLADSVQGGLQGLGMQDLVGERNASPTMPFSSNHLLAAAKWFHQKRLQRALASSGTHTLSAAHSCTDDPLWLPSNRVQEGMKLSTRRLWEGASGTTNETPSVGSNGSKTSSPQQVTRPESHDGMFDSFNGASVQASQLRDVMWHSHPQATRPDFCDGMLDSFNGAFVQTNQLRDAMWPSHLQVPRGVLVPSFPNHEGFNQPRGPCEGAAGKTKPRVRARRGQATDPHSIAERLRRERITDRIKLLQELVPHTNKTDRAIMLDEVIEYVKFLLVQVKVLSMSRLGNAALILPIVASLPEEKGTQTPAETQGEATTSLQESMPAIEEQVARLITNNVGAALQFLQRKGLCLVPIALTHSSKSSTDVSLSAPAQACSLNLPDTASIMTVAK